MNSVKVDRLELLAKIKGSLEKHNTVLQRAKSGYEKIVRDTLERHLSQLKQSGQIDLKEFNELRPPMDQTEEYETAISMLAMSTEKDVEISYDNYRHLVENKWHWRSLFIAQNKKYTDSISSSDAWNIEKEF